MIDVFQPLWLQSLFFNKFNSIQFNIVEITLYIKNFPCSFCLKMAVGDPLPRWMRHARDL